MDIITYRGEGYSTVIKFGSWRTGLIRWAGRFESLTYFERHNLTDEVFILLEGRAVLYTADKDMNAERHEMESGTLYNVRAAEWHAVTLSRDALVMVVENADTSKDNTDYYYLQS
jgi:mannose-6-phosphate isomerase-like protein (cupin superfamily)